MVEFKYPDCLKSLKLHRPVGDAEDRWTIHRAVAYLLLACPCVRSRVFFNIEIWKLWTTALDQSLLSMPVHIKQKRAFKKKKVRVELDPSIIATATKIATEPLGLSDRPAVT
jgi:hypothetical protein